MAERHPREEQLRRVHGAGALFAAAYGNVGSSIYYALGVVALYALGLTPVTFMIAGLIFAFTAASYAEATVMHPEAGGSSSFARYAFNEVVSFIAAWGQMLTYVVTIAISAFFVPHYLSVFWEPLEEGPVDVIFGIGLVAILAALNIRGTEESARLNLVLAIADIVTSILLIGLGMALVLDPEVLVEQVQFGIAPSWTDFLLGIAVGMVAYTGIETISNMAEEAKDAKRSIPRGVGWVVIVVIGIYGLLPVIALSAMPVTEGPNGFTTELGTTYRDNPVLGIVENFGLSATLTELLRAYVATFAAVILLIATNAALIGVSRVTYSMGQYRQLPERIRQVHPRFKTPYVAILVFAGVAAIVMLPGQTTFLATLYAFGATLSFTIAHVSVIRLRRIDPDPEGKRRKWRPPGSVRFRGMDLPLTAVFGAFGTSAAFLVAVALDPVILAVGGGWMVLGLLAYVAYRRHQQLPLGETIKVESVTPLGVEEVEYESVLVAFEEDPFSPETVATAARLAARRARGIHVVSLINVPTNLPLDAELDGEESEAQSKVEQAKLVGGLRVTGHTMRIRPGQGGRAICKEARAIKAEAIVMQLRYRNGQPLYGKTIQSVLADRPGRVIVVADPSAAQASVSRS